mmetsp:Transcript_17550/g.20749  ORF Transcript_17550/g.20749 Transcript_17550/m.20749 type:complete len:86 (-) Transcript_17550:405-662(-)
MVDGNIPRVEEINFLPESELPAKRSFCYCLKLRPSSNRFFDGAITLKMVTQICLLLDFFISSTYGLIFIIVNSSVWAIVSTLFFA